MAMYTYSLYRLDNNAFAGNVQVSMNPTQYAADLQGSEFRAVATGTIPDPVTAVITQPVKTTGTPSMRVYGEVSGGATMQTIFGGGGSIAEPNDTLRQGIPGAPAGGRFDELPTVIAGSPWFKVALVAVGIWFLVGRKW